MQVQVDNEHITAEEYADRRVIVVRRKATRVQSTAELQEAYEEAVEQSARYRDWGLVIDTRLAPGRNDADFESTMEALRDRVDGVFSRIAMVVETAAGELQARRLQAERRDAKPHASETFFTRDLEEAMGHAEGR